MLASARRSRWPSEDGSASVSELGHDIRNAEIEAPSESAAGPQWVAPCVLAGQCQAAQIGAHNGCASMARATRSEAAKVSNPRKRLCWLCMLQLRLRRPNSGGAGRIRTADTQFRKLSRPVPAIYFQRLTGTIQYKNWG